MQKQENRMQQKTSWNSIKMAEWVEYKKQNEDEGK